jgi:3-phosphoshikimate 1-carboxyvinyltransferase
MMVRIPKREAVHATFRAPPSKSGTHRAFITAALAKGDSFIRGPLHSEDTEVTRRTLAAWGVSFTDAPDGVGIRGSEGILHSTPDQRMDMRESGTTMRFFVSLALLCPTSVILDGSTRMRERPVGPLVGALNTLGARIAYLGREGYPPLHIEGMLEGGEVVISGKESSQYISSLLLVAPYATKDVTIRCKEVPVSRSYIDITLSIMQHFGVACERNGYQSYHVPSGSPYRGSVYGVEGDFSSAAYFMAIPAVCGGSVVVKGLDPSSTQGDRIFPDILASMGCRVRWTTERVEISCQEDLNGITVDLSSAPDIVQTVSMVAARARTPTTIRGVAHLRLKESDRLQATAEILRKLGAGVRVTDDAITILPGALHGGVIDPGNDHRTAMSAAILGLGIGGVSILQAECVNKSFPEFWSQLREAGLL